MIESYVVEDPKNDEITDFISFYSLPSSILKHPSYNTLRVAYSYYYFTDKYTVNELHKDALILAKNKGYDVFNALDVMQNKAFHEELKFGMGDGNLHLVISVGEGGPETRKAVEACVYQPLAAIQGSVSAEHGVGLEKKPYLGISRSEQEIELMRIIKRALDPNGILNPGKIFDSAPVGEAAA